ncbi:uncharacterized protein LOC123533806 [Mercenaria mercenaria]|uniref:uncharacterized protein LOC123533806 n=1 Tax=Mercenaria mercenaria TaxID=6596 RepID=UPI001E1DF90F|nr:uncharacterized protein LOC123533806 [Mercenaria mercenaria]
MAAAYGFLSTPAKLPKQWQPKLHEWSVYHSSHPDVARDGWRKWSGDRPDWYAWKSSSKNPDWYRRNVNTIRRADYKNINWVYEYPSKPTSRVHDDFISVTNEVMQKDMLKPMPPNRAYSGCTTHPKPDPIPKEVPVPKWGLYNPPHYEEPIRYNHFPPIKYNGYK